MRFFSGIQRKIVLPVSCVFAVAFAITALLAAQIVMRLQEETARKQAQDLARFVTEARLPLSHGLLDRVRAVFGKDVVFHDARTGAVTSTLPAAGAADLAQLPGAARLTLAGTVYRPVSSPVGADGSWLSLLVPEEELKAASAAAARPVLLIAFAGAAVTIVLGIVITRGITKPLRDLAGRAESIALAGRPSIGPPRTGSDEVGHLASAFQRMLVRLQESQQKLLEAEKLAAVGRVATGIAHEIRNPLASMKMNAQIIQEAAPGDESPALIVREIERLQLLVDELLYYSRPAPLRAEPSDVNAVLEEAATVLLARFEHARVAVRRELAAGLPAVRLDRARFKQVAINLMLNAMQAMPGGGTLTLRTSRDAAGVAVDFDDTGCGVPKGADAAIFEPFFSTREGGIGIGLAVSRKIVEEHGGTIGFTRKPVGTVFRVRLPI